FERPSSRKSDPAQSYRINAEGLRLMDRGQIGMAIEKFRLAIAFDPGNIEALNNLAVAMGKEGDVRGSLVVFHRALRLDPGNPKLHSNLALALRRSGRPPDAVSGSDSSRVRQCEVPPGDGLTGNQGGGMGDSPGRTATGHPHRPSLWRGSQGVGTRVQPAREARRGHCRISKGRPAVSGRR